MREFHDDRASANELGLTPRQSDADIRVAGVQLTQIFSSEFGLSAMSCKEVPV